MPLTLYIGNKNYSSWSMRPWLAMKHANIPFDEMVLPMGDPDFRARILSISPAGKVPVLVDDGMAIWDSLAILLHLGTSFPKAGLWPAETAARARAWSILAEMHSGFAQLRRQCPMNLWRRPEPMRASPEVVEEVARISALWRETRAEFGNGRDFLFGAFSAADAMYAPVAARLRTYGLAVDAEAEAYVEAIHRLPAFKEWRDAALQETQILPHNELDWPQVKRA